MVSWFFRSKVRCFVFAALAITTGLIYLSHLRTSYYYPRDFLDRIPGARRPVVRALVVAPHQIDTGWIKELTNPSTTAVSYEAFIRTGGVNKGREANVYLSFVIANYDFLPEYTVFIHGHESAWHQENSLLITLQMLNFTALDTDGYVNLRCDWYPSCPAEIRPQTHDGIRWGPGVHKLDTENAIVEAWPEFFPDVEIPSTISSQCCAQFAVTRDAIRRRERETYIKMHNWLMRTPHIDDVSGRVFEKLWAYIFTNETVHCPPPSTCACKYFGTCDPDRRWPMPPISTRLVDW